MSFIISVVIWFDIETLIDPIILLSCAEDMS